MTLPAKRPLKVAILGSQENTSFRIRCMTPLSWLLKQGVVEMAPLWETGVVLLNGPWRTDVLPVIRSLRRNDIRILANLDAEALAGNAQSPELLGEVFSLTDGLLVPTENLASTLAQSHSRIFVQPDGLDIEAWQKAAKPREFDRVRVIGFAGDEVESADLHAIVRPVLARLANRLANEQIRFVCFGVKPAWLGDLAIHAETIGPCRAEDYPSRLARLGVDIALAPLADSGLNRMRSAVKFWEYTAAGAVTIASKAGPYPSAIQHGSTGILVDNQPEAWAQAIATLLQDHRLRRKLFESAEQSLPEHDVSRVAPELLKALEATQPNRDRVLFTLRRTQTEVRRDVDIVIPIYNSPGLVRQAIQAALPELDDSHRLILVDDASPDSSIGLLLDDYKDRPWVTVHRCTKNNGFVGACNFAVEQLSRPNADVILMNADTRPMPGFVRRLAATAGSNPTIGTVTAVSNEGWIASVPNLQDASEMAALRNPLALSPTACGFLLYIKREVIRKYGLFDPVFSPGYCEEVDFSLRISAEYANVIDSGCWTWHANSASFGDAKYQLSRDHNAIIDQRYPHFRTEFAAFNAKHPLLDHRWRMLTSSRDPRPRVLHVLHFPGRGHGTGKHAFDLSDALSDRFLSLQISATESPDPKQERLELSCGEVLVHTWPYTQPGWPLTAAEIPANDALWSDLIGKLKPSVIHVHHLKNHALTLLPRLLATGIPAIVSLHDNYLLCPDFALQQCPGVNSCATCFPKRFNGPAEYQQLRRVLVGACLQQAAAVVAPSHSTADRFLQVYPGLNIQVIPHGIRPFPKIARQPVTKVRFGVLGGINAVKGIEILLKAWPMAAPGDSAELHLYGGLEPQYARQIATLGMKYHGPYCEADLPKILSQIDVGLMPAQAPETFSYTLSEFFAGGVPVIGSNYGALSERIEDGVNGLKIAKDDVQAWAAAISLLIQDGALRERLSRGVRPPETLQNMAGRYAGLYERAIQKRGLTSDEPAVDLEHVAR